VFKEAILNPNNHLFALARQGKRQPSVVITVAVVVVILALGIAGQVFARTVVARLNLGENSSIAGQVAENVVGFLPIHLGMWMWLRSWCKRSFRSLGFASQSSTAWILRGTFSAALMIGTTAGLAIIPGAFITPGPETSVVAALGAGLLTLASFAIQSSAEEVLFRGWLLAVIGARYGAVIGILVSAALFSLAHIGGSPLELVNLFLFGVFTAIFALSEGGIWAVCAWHAVWNWMMSDAMGFALSGKPNSGLLISVHATGPDVITGGMFGLEGGLPCTVVLVLGIGIVELIVHRENPEAVTPTRGEN
jgi:membrane protease YdiL (CAAX protease family)